MPTRVRLDCFGRDGAFSRGRGKLVEVAWYLCKMVFFLSAMPWPPKVRPAILNLFGGRIARTAYIKPRVNIHFPWRLCIGDYSCLGEGVEIYNFEQVKIGDHSCISQNVTLCAANHDYKDITLKYRNAPIDIGDGVWVGASAFVGPGVRLADEVVVTACAVVTKDMPAAMVCSGNPCVPVRKRWE